MSDVIDTNVVEIRFDNSQFIENVSQTIDSVNTLKEALVYDSGAVDIEAYEGYGDDTSTNEV